MGGSLLPSAIICTACIPPSHPAVGRLWAPVKTNVSVYGWHHLDVKGAPSRMRWLDPQLSSSEAYALSSSSGT